MSAAVYLADQQWLLSRFTQAIAGRYLQLRSTEMLAGSFRPAGATTDGQAIYLPESIAVFDTPRGNLGLYRVSILHQLGYYLYGTFDFRLEPVESQLEALSLLEDGGPAKVRRHDDRPVDLERLFDRFASPLLARRLFLVLEAYRIDCRLPSEFPGVRSDLQAAMAHALAQRDETPRPNAPVARLIETMVDFSLGADRAGLLAEDASGTLSDLLAAMTGLASTDADVYDTVAALLDCFPRLWRFAGQSWSTATHSLPGGDEPPDGAAPREESGATVPLLGGQDLELAGVGFRGDLLPELVQRQLRLAELMRATEALESMGRELPADVLAEHLGQLRAEFAAREQNEPARQPTMPPFSGAAPDQAATRPADAAHLAQLIRQELDASRIRARLEASVLRRAFGEVRNARRSYFYDEWDYRQQSYRKGWCRLHEHRLQGDDAQRYRLSRLRYRLLAARIEHELRRVRAEALQRVRQVTDGDELDWDAALNAIIDRRAGQTADERVYSRKQRAKREVAAAFLLDMSASTDDEITPLDTESIDLAASAAQPRRELTQPSIAPRALGARRRVIDVEQDALVLMSEALTVLGDAFAIYGFSGDGRDDVEFYIAKEFDDAMNARSKAALMAMRPQRSTRMGPAIRHATRRLLSQETPLKVLIILSDGFPQDRDYGPDRNDHEYGIRDTAKAIEEAERRGITTFCITVDRSGHDYLRSMCAADRYLVIDEVESLPEELNKIYQRLTV